ncbi:hypothetical protein Aeqsu_1750 [Aequorivita sublithincola DSM 14238]|uniref:TNF family profile domain-containing protein n=1 Tax=Aequorivita sublithincola (strain DSM 14238 / LMG 21431 / ACAM 643 / 9-3) TaxID=746697 RepID=I3YW62_AEQSU|nr:hypothetical protein [Aequorivita sublithincola]AFL81230.1 hypothetical protein Aeqsu_1750 [Aequorivita sublithincola DSM 14238]
MKKITYYKPRKGFFGLLAILLLVLSTATAQVGIGTTNPAPGSALQIDSTVGALVPPRVTNAQMIAIQSPLEGSIVYNNTFSALFMFSSGTWNNLTRPDLPSIVMSKDWGQNDDNNLVKTGNDTYYNFPLTPAEVVSNEPNFFTVTASGTIQVKKAGNYLITAGFSVNSLPTGGHKYIIGIYKGTNTLIGYLVRGNVIMQSDDEFGTSGVLMLPFNADEKISLKYVLNNNGLVLDARFFKIGIIKI